MRSASIFTKYTRSRRRACPTVAPTMIPWGPSRVVPCSRRVANDPPRLAEAHVVNGHFRGGIARDPDENERHDLVGIYGPVAPDFGLRSRRSESEAVAPAEPPRVKPASGGVRGVRFAGSDVSHESSTPTIAGTAMARGEGSLAGVPVTCRTPSGFMPRSRARRRGNITTFSPTARAVGMPLRPAANRRAVAERCRGVDTRRTQECAEPPALRCKGTPC